MLDGLIRPKIEPLMNQWAGRVLQSGLTANKLTVIGFAFGFAACFCVGMQLYPLGLFLILLNRFIAALAGSAAKTTGITALGSYIDIVCDFFIFAGFAFFFCLSVTGTSLAATLLIFSYLAMAVSYLGQTTFFPKANPLDTPRGGLVENTEMTLFMVACCVFPKGFAAFAALFALLCFTTAAWRFVTTLRPIKS